MSAPHRSLSLQKEQVSIRVFVHAAEGRSVFCRYEIDWPEGRRSSEAAGVDSIQALHLALQTIGFGLYSSEHHRNGRLQWNKQNNGYGFPVPADMRDQLVGDDRRFES